MDPESALPSYRVYRGSLLALIVGSVVAVWLLVLPPGGADSDGPPPSIAGVLPSATPTAAAPPRPTPSPTVAPGGAVTVATPSPTPTPTATPSVTVPEREYTVEPGDSLLAIVDRFLAPGGDGAALLERIVEINDIADVSSIGIGQVITIPAQ